MRYQDMLVETPYALVDVEDRRVRTEGSDLGHCSYCGVQDDDPWHDVGDLTVYRVWTLDSIYRPDAVGSHEQGGTWQWRCAKHPKRAWSPHSHLAPVELLPPERHPCEELDGLLKRKCGIVDQTRQFEEGWICADHARKYEVLADQRRLTSHEDLEAGESASDR